MKRERKLLSVILAVAVAISALPFVFSAIGERAYKADGINGLVSYLFSGDEKDFGGYAEGTISLSGAKDGEYYALYWANGSGILDGYEHIITVPSTQSKVVIPANTVIPDGATSLAVFTVSALTEYDFGLGTTSSFRYYYPELKSKELSAALDIVSLPNFKRMNENRETTFASFSDFHINYTYGDEKAIAALNWTENNGATYVLSSGDFTGTGYEDELSRFETDAKSSLFPYENIIECPGNHESQEIGSFQYFTAGNGKGEVYAAVGDYGENYPKEYTTNGSDFKIINNNQVDITTGEETRTVKANIEYHDKSYGGENKIADNNVGNRNLISVKFSNGTEDSAMLSPWYYVVAEGDDGERNNVFVSLPEVPMGTSLTSNCDCFTEYELDWLEGVFNRFNNDDNNIFLLEHANIYNFASGDPLNSYAQPIKVDEKYSLNIRFKNILSTYKNVIWMHGHTHMSFYNNINYPNQCYSDMDGTFCRSVHNSSVSQPRWYEQKTDENGNLTDTYKVVYVTNQFNSEGYLADIYSDDIVYSGTNLNTGLRIPLACVIMPTVVKESETITDESSSEASSSVSSIVSSAASSEVSSVVSETSSSVSASEASSSNESSSVSSETESKVHFDGKGTRLNPYLIKSPSDFYNLTSLFSLTGTETSHYYRQTADIDMSNFEKYNGTNASGSNKLMFTGSYDGAGHKIIVNIESNESNCSLFPYVTSGGRVINLTFEGSFIGINTQYLQPIRTIGSSGNTESGFAINIINRMTMGGAKVTNGLCQSLYGTVINFYNKTTPTSLMQSVSKTISGTIQNTFYNYNKDMMILNGGVLSDDESVKEAFNSYSDSPYRLMKATLENNAIEFSERIKISGDANDDGKLTMTDVVLVSRTAAMWDGVDVAMDADINGDEVINSEDMVMITKKLAHSKNS